MGQGATAPTKQCTYCGETILAVAQKCRHCGEYFDSERRAAENAPDVVERMLIPVGRPLSAIAAGYLGLFSVLPLFGIAAIIVSLVAFRTLKRHPELSGRGRATFGLVMGSAMTLVYSFPLFMIAYELYQNSQGRRP